MHTDGQRGGEPWVIRAGLVALAGWLGAAAPGNAAGAQHTWESNCWSRTGLGSAPPDYSRTIDVSSFGATGNGTNDDTAAFLAAVAGVGATSTVVYIPPGTYRLTQRIHLKARTILRGAGSGRTRLVFEGSNTSQRCIGIACWDSSQTNAWTRISGGAGPGMTNLIVTSVQGIAAGDLVEIEQLNDPAWGFVESWQSNMVGQVCEVASVDAASHALTLADALRISLDPVREPRLRKLVIIRDSGIEGLSIRKADDAIGCTIELKYAFLCWIEGVESEMTYKAHVAMNACLRCEVRGSRFSGSWYYGGGGAGYGVLCGRHNSACLVEDNVFHTLRHSMIVGSGAIGNVFGYNYSTNRALDPDLGTPQADISVHGHYVALNLFEGNVAEDADVPDYYHPAGPANTLFRNRISNRAVAVDIASDNQHVAGNELPYGNVRIASGVTGTVEELNVLAGDPPGEAGELPYSLYQSAMPAFFPIDDPEVDWPAIGPGRGSGAGKNPAQQRAEGGHWPAPVRFLRVLRFGYP